MADAVQLIQLRASQYVSAAGLVILIWDHLLTLQDEVDLIWKAKFSVPKALFLFNRYVVPVALILQAHGISGVSNPYLSDKVCRGWFALATVIGMVSIATSNFLVLLRLWVLWDRKPRLVLWTLVLFIVTQMAALGLTGYFVSSMLPILVFDPTLYICNFTEKPKLILLWSPGIVFELMIFATTCWNALDRPMPQDVQMAKILYRDGSVYFFGLFALRLVNLVLSITAPLPLIFLGLFFIWSISNITLARLILNLRRVSVDTEEFELQDPLQLSDLHRSHTAQSFELQPKILLS
ncbi:hypothetical protein F5I97DRAFT_1953475 [Phlebopus sp. FC_14]|nr:hypothetical protein F5I97DRAFT_1953475 [Phlebopus sp. FC_14]